MGCRLWGHTESNTTEVTAAAAVERAQRRVLGPARKFPISDPSMTSHVPCIASRYSFRVEPPSVTMPLRCLEGLSEFVSLYEIEGKDVTFLF